MYSAVGEYHIKHLRRIGGGNSVERRELGESRQQRRLAPRRFVERSVEGRRRRIALDAGHANFELVVAADVGQPRRGRDDGKRRPEQGEQRGIHVTNNATSAARSLTNGVRIL